MERIGPLANRLKLPSVLARVHNVFHVLMLRWYIKSAGHVLEEISLEICDDMTYIEQLVGILDRRNQVRRTETISLVKVLWYN